MKRLLVIPLIPLLFIAIALPLSAQGRDFVPSGTQIRVHVQGPIDVARWDRGRIYPARVESDVYANDGDLVIPRGSNCELIVRQAGPDQLALDLESITAGGRRYVLDASGPQFNMNENQYNNGGGVIGNILGAIAGNGNVQYQGDHIRVPAGSDITFQLQQPLRVAHWGDEGYDRGGSHYHHEENHGWYR